MPCLQKTNRGTRGVLPAMAGAIALVCLTRLFAAEASAKIAPPAFDNPKTAGALQTAVLAGGCFWGLQGVFEHVRGVQAVWSGYAGGGQAQADYEQVSTGRTGHAESVRITFDPSEISYGELLRVFFTVAHDPTQLNRQGPDSGTQYRSDIFYANEAQKKVAVAYIVQLEKSKVFRRPIVTRVDALKGFYPAEDYHQDFLIHHPRHPYIVFNDLPKIANLKRVFPDYFRSQPAAVDSAASR